MNYGFVFMRGTVYFT